MSCFITTKEIKIMASKLIILVNLILKTINLIVTTNVLGNTIYSQFHLTL